MGHIPDVTPAAILAMVPHADIDAYLHRQASSGPERLKDEIAWELERTERQCGTCPPKEVVLSLVEQQVIQSRVDLERWLFQWERQTLGEAQALVPPDTSYLEWFSAKTIPSTLLLLPVVHGWDTRAYLHWYGALHSGTMLQFLVGRAPATPDETFQLAWEQVALAECTTILPGVSIRDHARALLTMDRWFIHERP